MKLLSVTSDYHHTSTKTLNATLQSVIGLLHTVHTYNAIHNHVRNYKGSVISRHRTVMPSLISAIHLLLSKKQPINKTSNRKIFWKKHKDSIRSTKNTIKVYTVTGCSKLSKGLPEQTA